MAAMICHGAFSRFPDLRVACVENGAGFVRPLFDNLSEAYRMAPQDFTEDPIETFKRNVYVHPFHEENIHELVRKLGADHILFGSDFPHPEGLADPLSYVDDLEGLVDDDKRKIMGGNLGRLMGVEAAAA
jgi:predicted TIM-barrel fold metal-dependent hydrolase